MGSGNLTKSKLYIQFLSIGGKLGVNLFIMITGYFMCDSNYKVQTIKKIAIQTWVYSSFIYLLFYFTGLEKMNMKYFLKSFFPIILSNYWFVTTFIVLFLLIPFLKILLKNIEKSMFQKLLLVLAILLIIPVNIGFGNVDWFIFLFFISAYIKRYSVNLFDNNIKNLIISVIMYVIIFLSIILFNLLGRKFSVFLGKELFFIGQSSPFILITSIFLFQFFKNLKIENKVINEIIKKIAITTFGIYLIHDNFIVRKYLWIKLFKNSFYKNSNFLFLHSIISILLIFIFCFLVDILLQKTILKIFYKIENKTTVKMITYFSKFYNYYENKSLKKIQISSLK